MVFNSDSHFEIGSSHKVCEDFAIHGSMEDPNGDILHYGIVSDGCSSSMVQNGIRLPINVDTGARLLAIIAKQAIKESLMTLKVLDENLNNALRHHILSKMDIIARQIGLPIQAMDCTLLISIVYKNRYFSTVWGDGVVVYDTNIFIFIKIIEFESRAPFYLSYSLDDERKDLYKEKFGKQNKIVTTLKLDHGFTLTGKPEIETIPYYESVMQCEEEVMQCHEFPGNNCLIKSLSVISDGVQTYQKKREGKHEKYKIPVEQIIPKFVEINGTKGNFLRRIMNLVKQWEKKKEIDHYDDFSIATIVRIQTPKDQVNG